MSEEPEGEELVPEDDAVIGRAFRLSLVVAAAAAAVVAAVLLLSRGKPAPPPGPTEQGPAPQVRVDEPEPPSVSFRDVTAESGLDFRHESGARGDKLLPETMGGGAAFLDYDGDGDPDLCLVNSAPWPEDRAEGEVSPTMALYANDGSGRFADVTSGAGLDVSFYGMGLAAGDYDCDGDPDLFFTAVGPDHLFRNDAGRFVEMDSPACGAPEDWSTCAVFFDADGDGDLDLFVGNYVRWNREIDFAVDYKLTGLGRAYGPPTNFAGSFSRLYRNEGQGRFVDASEEAGILVANPATGVPAGKALGVLAIDADEDGDVDLFVANDTVQNHVFRNRGDGTFEEVGLAAGLAFDRDGNSRGAMGIDAAWYKNDQTLAVAIGNFANEMSSFYVRQPETELFVDLAIGEGIGAPSRKRLKFGVVFLDYDLDGRLDLLQANGHIESEINVVQSSQTYEQPAQLFWNAGTRRTFVEVPEAGTGDLCRPLVGRGAAYADVDADGDLDVLLTQAGRSPLLLRNEQSLGHHWLRLRLLGRGCNRDAIGAVVELYAEGATQRRTVMPTRGYLTQVELPLTFGLGTAERYDLLRVRWPDGTASEHQGLALDRLHVLRQE